MLTTLIDWGNARCIGFSALVSLGEMAEVNVADWLDYTATDSQTRAMLLYFDSVTTPASSCRPSGTRRA